jgi:hypothetical protein
MSTLLSDIEAFCAAHGLSESQLGELAMKDRKFVNQLRDGRDLRVSTVKRVRDFMISWPREAA